jgi:hypothetical protein
MAELTALRDLLECVLTKEADLIGPDTSGKQLTLSHEVALLIIIIA